MKIIKNRIPCKDCLVLAMCKIKYHNNIKYIKKNPDLDHQPPILSLSNKCSILSTYIADPESIQRIYFQYYTLQIMYPTLTEYFKRPHKRIHIKKKPWSMEVKNEQ